MLERGDMAGASERWAEFRENECQVTTEFGPKRRLAGIRARVMSGLTKGMGMGRNG